MEYLSCEQGGMVIPVLMLHYMAGWRPPGVGLRKSEEPLEAKSFSPAVHRGKRSEDCSWSSQSSLQTAMLGTILGSHVTRNDNDSGLWDMRMIPS